MKTRAKRRSAKEGEAFRGHLIAVARQLFIEEGVDAVSIRKIAGRAGCPPMTFYVYFRNKLEVLRHIWDDVLRAAAATAEAAAAEASDPALALQAYALTWCQYWIDNPDSYRMVFSLQDRSGPLAATYYPEGADIRGHFKPLRDLIERGVAEGLFAQTEPELAVEAMLALCVGISHCVLTMPEYRWDPLMAEAAVGQMIQGLGSADGKNLASRPPLTTRRGLRILVVEDEMTVAMMADAMLTGLGHQVVGPAMRLEDALAPARSADFDVAMLDVNLGRDKSFPAADILRDRGIPFFFATGYGLEGIVPEYRDRLVLHKPFETADLERALKAVTKADGSDQAE
jgi:AcrR family transcriptional regulator